jgi:HisJ family histidinol phosphate phosphatase
MNGERPFLWETHGVHIGTGKDHVKHGIDTAEPVIEAAIREGFPAVSFVIHTPRLTGFRYQIERDTDIKFIRGDTAYFGFSRRMEALRERYRGRITILSGIELEWMGPGLGLQWNRSKLFQAYGVDFVIGSVHFSYEGIPYDGSQADTERLVARRGGIEEFWASYLDEVIEMVDSSWELIHVVGHLDLPKLFAPLPESLRDVEHSSHFLARRMRTLLEMVSDLNLALDLNTSGLRKGCGPYPDPAFLKRAYQLAIPVAIGTDSHQPEELGQDYSAALRLAREAGYRYYVSFSGGIPRKRSLSAADTGHYWILNLTSEMLKLRFEHRLRQETPKFSFGGRFHDLLEDFPGSVSLGSFNAVRARRDDRSVTLSDSPDGGAAPRRTARDQLYLYSHHTDTPGTLSILFNTLASEEINVETAYLNSLSDGTATAYLTVSGDPGRVREAVDFVMGTASDRFYTIDPARAGELPPAKEARVYLLEVDGVALPIPLSRQMVLTVHSNRPGTLLILLSALASRNVNVVDLQLGKRGERGFAVLGVQGDPAAVAEVLTQLGPQYYEAHQILLAGLEEREIQTAPG